MVSRQKGFTLVETTIVMGMLAMVMFFILGMLQEFQKLKKITQSVYDAESGIVLSSTIIQKYIHLAEPSFNNILDQKDDNGNEFFDLVADLPVEKLNLGATGTRIYTMGPNQKVPKYKINFLLSDISRTGDIVYYDPKNAYTDIEPGDDLTKSDAVQYNSINHTINGKKCISDRNPSMWQQGELVLMRSEEKERYVGGDGSIDERTNYRQHSILGRIGGDDLKKETLDELDGKKKVRNEDPKDQLEDKDFDDHLRKSRGTGGGSSNQIVEAVKAVQLRMEPVPGSGYYSLTFYEYDPTTKTYTKNPVMVASDVLKVVFSRESIARTLIRVNVQFKKGL